MPACAHPGCPLPATPVTAWVAIQKVATWPETGMGILYSEATGGYEPPEGNGPVLGPAQPAVLSALGAAAVAVPVVLWRRRAGR